MTFQTLKSKKNLQIHNYDKRISQELELLENDSNVSNASLTLIKEYHRAMITETLAKATISKHIQTLGNLCRMIDVEWTEATKSDIDKLVAKIIEKYADDSGQETHTSRDHKKILKIFFRWFKFGSRSFVKVGNPSEIRDVNLKNVKDKIIREDLITKDEAIEKTDEIINDAVGQIVEYFHGEEILVNHNTIEMFVKAWFNRRNKEQSES